jgi:hypothetical protein
VYCGKHALHPRKAHPANHMERVRKTESCHATILSILVLEEVVCRVESIHEVAPVISSRPNKQDKVCRARARG